jgi:hypothetical protein
VQYSATYRRRQPDSEYQSHARPASSNKLLLLGRLLLGRLLSGGFLLHSHSVVTSFHSLTVRMSKMRVNAFLRAMKKFCEECVAKFALHEANFSYVTRASLVRARVARKMIF